jgi:adenylate cyclase
MADEGFKRKLTAILSADVEGYSRLMGEDEDATIRTLTTYRELMSALIQKQRGRVVDSPGDNLLAEFGSVVDGVRCAVEIQEELNVRNAELPENRKMQFRIGVNLGDVVEEGGQIYGDGVNIAARVEGLAEGGGICISGSVYDSIKNKLSLSYESLGEHTVKNITEPVRVYRMRVGPGVREEKAGPRRWQKAALAAVVVLVVGAAAVAVWNFYLRPAPPSVEPASVGKMEFSLPDKPSIAVLPFDNLSGDPEQEYIANGITESIITALSKLPQMFVIARKSTFTYKGKPVKVKQVSEELGVRYILEGSFQKEGDRLRITAQLIDATKGHHLWSERYDRDLKDFFVLQDEITKNILIALQVKLTEGEQARVWGQGTRNFEAYMKQTEGRELLLRFNIEDLVRSRQLREEAIALDPEFERAIIGLAWVHLMEILFGSSKSPGESMEQAEKLAQKALDLDPYLTDVYGLLGYISLMKGQHEKAVAQHEKAVALAPNGAEAHYFLAKSLTYTGRPEEAIPFFEKALRLNPFPASNYLVNLGHAYRIMGRYEEALAEYEKAVHLQPNFLIANACLAGTYSLLAREKEAREAVTKVLRLNPKFSVEHFAKNLPFKNQADKDRYLECLYRAGLK